MDKPNKWEAFTRSIRAQAMRAGFKSIAALHRATKITEERLRYILDHPESVKLKELVILESVIELDINALTDVLIGGGKDG